MVLQHIWGLFTNPRKEWEAIRDDECTIGKCYAAHVLILAAIPPISGFIGTTQFGWQIGAGDPVKLTSGSALQISIVYFGAILVAVYVIGALIHWMSETYGAKKPMSRCLALAVYTAVPLFLVGFIQIYPVLWINFLFGLPALAYAVYLLYSGVPVMMEIPPERGFMFASAILGLGLVALVAFLAGTAILWDFGMAPEFVS